jgi:hypothetical protein
MADDDDDDDDDYDDCVVLCRAVRETFSTR